MPEATDRTATTQDDSPLSDVPPPVVEEQGDAEAERLRALVAEFARACETGGDSPSAWKHARDELVAAGPEVVPFLFELPADTDAWYAIFDAIGLLPQLDRTPPLDLVCSRLRQEAGADTRFVGAALTYLFDSVPDAWAHQPEADLVLDTLAEQLDPRLGRTHDEAYHAYYTLAIYGRRNPKLVADRMAACALRFVDEGADDALLTAVVLQNWGPDISHVLPRLLPRLDEFDLGDEVFDLAAASAGTVPELLPLVIEGLETEGDDAARLTRIRAAESLTSWGVAAEPARPALEALLASEDEEERLAAARALAVLSRPTEEVRRILLGHRSYLGPLAYLGRDILLHGESYLPRIGGNGAEGWQEDWIDHLLDMRPDLAMSVVERLSQAPTRQERERVAWLFGDGDHVRPDGLHQLPEDYRAFVVETLASGSARLRLLLAMRFREDPTVGESANAVLEELSTHEDEKIRAAVEEVLRPRVYRQQGLPEPPADAELLAAIERGLAEDFGRLDGSLVSRANRRLQRVPRLSPTVVRALIESGRSDGLALLRRSEDREIVLREAVEWFLENPVRGRIDWDAVRTALLELDSEALRLRETVEGVVARESPDAAERRKHPIYEVFANIAGESRELALRGNPHLASATRRLVELRAFDDLVLHVGLDAGRVRPAVPDVETELHWAVRRAVETPEEDPHRELRVRGAARLLGRVPPDQALYALRALLSEPSAEVRRIALETYSHATIEREARLTEDVVELMFEDRRGGFAFLLYASHTADDRRPVVMQGLQRLLRTGIEAERLVAARLLVQRGVDPAEPARVTREVLRARRARPSRQRGVESHAPAPTDAAPYQDDSESPAWASEWSHDVAAILGAVDPIPEDVNLILGVIPPGEPRVLLPLLARMGPDAAAAVPTLRSWLPPNPDELPGPEGPSRAAAAVAVLHAIGPAARSALPGLRSWLLKSGDPAAVLRAIEAIER